jgi:hypothetical protein
MGPFPPLLQKPPFLLRKSHVRSQPRIPVAIRHYQLAEEDLFFDQYLEIHILLS